MKVGKNENSHSTQNLTREQLDYYHQKGIIPDWAYYSRIGETPTEELYSQSDKTELDRHSEKELEKQLEKTLDDILKNIKTSYNVII